MKGNFDMARARAEETKGSGYEAIGILYNNVQIEADTTKKSKMLKEFITANNLEFADLLRFLPLFGDDDYYKQSIVDKWLENKVNNFDVDGLEAIFTGLNNNVVKRDMAIKWLITNGNNCDVNDVKKVLTLVDTNIKGEIISTWLTWPDNNCDIEALKEILPSLADDNNGKIKAIEKWLGKEANECQFKDLSPYLSHKFDKDRLRRSSISKLENNVNFDLSALKSAVLSVNDGSYEAFEVVTECIHRWLYKTENKNLHNLIEISPFLIPDNRYSNWTKWIKQVPSQQEKINDFVVISKKYLMNSDVCKDYSDCNAIIKFLKTTDIQDIAIYEISSKIYPNNPQKENELLDAFIQDYAKSTQFESKESKNSISSGKGEQAEQGQSQHSTSLRNSSRGSYAEHALSNPISRGVL